MESNETVLAMHTHSSIEPGPAAGPRSPNRPVIALSLLSSPRCSEQICPRQIVSTPVWIASQDGRMSEESKLPLFNPRMRRELYEQRVLVLDGPLDDDNGTLLATQLMALATQDASSDIALWIHSPGGSVPSMLAIRDIMRLIPCDVSTLVLGIAYSAGQFLLSSGARGKRRALPHSRVLMHQGSAGIGGTAVDIELQAGDLRHTRDTVLGLIAEDTGQPVERIFEDSLHDRWYTAQEALDYGFIDAIVQNFDEIAPQNRPRLGFGVTQGVGQ
ncbi:ClpP family protease [Nonomuraea sp. MTCD27]|uniref:ClpP family protease n=2 Tax=Nonomuraea TaxID=83681 RepID=UPI0035BFF4C0